MRNNKFKLEHRFTFRTDFDTADKVVREARAKGVSVSRHINQCLNPNFWKDPYNDKPPIGEQLLLLLRCRLNFELYAIVDKIQEIDEEWGEWYTPDGEEVKYWAPIPQTPVATPYADA